MIRKLVFLSLILALIALPVAACAQEAPAPELPKSLVLLNSGPQASPGGIALSLMAENWKNHLGITSGIQAAGGTAPAARGLRDENGDLSAGNAINMGQAFRGIGPFEGEPSGKMLRAVLAGYFAAYSLIARDDSGINTVGDLVGKKVQARRQANQDLEAIFTAILNEYGVSPDSTIILEHSNAKEEMESVVVGSAHAGYFFSGEPGTGHVIPQELLASVDAHLVQMDADKLAAAAEKLGTGLSVVSIQTTAFPGMTEPINALAGISWLVGTTRLSAGTAYALVKSIQDNWAEFASGHAQAHWWAKENTPKQKPPMPYHEGTVRYFKEVGLWTSEMEQWQKDLLAEAR